MKIVIASNNANKLVELRAMLEPSGFEVYGLSEVGFNADIEETGTTFTENALIKARTVRDACGVSTLADDSGLCVDVLNGEPGVYSARYGGDNCKSDAERTALLLKNMESIENRAAHFVSVIAVAFPDGTELCAEGMVDGQITREPRGGGGFGYDPVFELSDGLTMSEIPSERKNEISHRANALAKMKILLENYTQKR